VIRTAFANPPAEHDPERASVGDAC